MRMTLHSDYGLRVLTYLALHPDRPCTVSEIATSYRLSRNHLLKVALNLKNAGFVEAVRGRTGGVRLGRPPNEIGIGAVIRSLEEDFALVECFKDGGGSCIIAPACRIKGIFSEALAAYMATLEKYTLQDALVNAPSLRTLFDLTVPPAAAQGATLPEPTRA
ncbi:Rrf2 family transcriptional regulator [Mesorhizobium sp. NBSH29]|uniref:RrF2 family transcriptional regulator n=1 Tax=Mesorhizobium sp. NBSH29 TaxID=2654249 RepID=UPI0018964E7C|nr:Rrf2 family transcriptional regulator [Mesorhizobium sp. NBSH29]QPC85473.1 Rrf2 family transcriptional regulator [Mesorhizobium sp. NBSH29]